VDGEPEKLGEVAQGAGFKLLCDVVDTRDGQRAIQGGVAGSHHLALHLPHLHVVAVNEVGEVIRGVSQMGFKGLG